MDPQASGAVSGLSERAREIFRAIVDSYLEHGEPVGSRTLSQRLASPLSAATIRNVMADLEDMGLLSAPHLSAGRLPTELGLRLFVDGLLQVGELGESERREIEARVAGTGRSLEDLLTSTITTLSGLSHCAGLVATPRLDRKLKHVELVAAGQGQALVVMVTEDGAVENRLIHAPIGLPVSALIEASNYLNARIRGLSLSDARVRVRDELAARRSELDALTARLVEDGIASWSASIAPGSSGAARALIVRGQARLLDDVTANEDLERIRLLFDELERKEGVLSLLDLVESAEGVRIFIGSESKLFSLSGSSVVVSPYRGEGGRIVGAIGVIGPTRINYARIIPMVDYTARLLGRALPAVSGGLAKKDG